MKILYLSAMASSEAIKEASSRASNFSSYAMQKFSHLVTIGLCRNGHKVKALSTFYQPNVGIGYYRKSEIEKGVQFRYIPTLNFTPVRMVCITLYCFFYVLFWGLRDKNNKSVVCDVLNVSACIGAVFASRFMGLRCVGIMTDMPGIGVGNKNSSSRLSIGSVAAWINRKYLGHFSHYVFITEQMNEAINTRHRPYIVMEGLVDIDMEYSDIKEKVDNRVVLYAGGLYEQYGIKVLVEAFIKADVAGTELWLYGSGSFAEQMSEYHQRDSRVVYKGIRPNSEVVEAEQRAMLLVNPRFTKEEFTKYSFPSKNMEYMVSGTPLLTTVLPGMPKEYYPHVFLFDKGENEEGYAKVLREVMNLPEEKLLSKGHEARQWVLLNKNNVSQAKRIIELVSHN